MKISMKWEILLGVTGLGVMAVALMPPIPQWPSYNHFADERTLWGVRNFWDVISNIPFFLVAIAGFITLRRQWKQKYFQDWKAAAPYIVFFIGVLLTGWGSSYYHLSPDNLRLVWDRIPMTIVFMSLVAIVLSERVGARIGFWVLWPLLLLGAVSVFYWSWTESLGRGDLSPYGFIQFYPPLFIGMVLYFFPKPFPSFKDFGPVVGFYALAKVFEYLDEPIYQLTGFMSGHALKHLAAAASVYWILVLLERRKKRKT